MRYQCRNRVSIDAHARLSSDVVYLSLAPPCREREKLKAKREAKLVSQQTAPALVLGAGATKKKPEVDAGNANDDGNENANENEREAEEASGGDRLSAASAPALSASDALAEQARVGHI